MANLGALTFSAAQIALMNRATIRAPRQFGGMVPAVVVKERHTDRLEVTSHPVERGAQIADHAIQQPAEVTLEVGWSSSPPAEGLTLLPQPASSTMEEIYQQLLRLQSQRVLCDVQTGKRFYKGMLLVEISVTTEKETEAVLMATCLFRQLILATTVTLSLAPPAGGRPANPGSALPVSNNGTKQLLPGDSYPATPQAGP